MVGIAGFRKGRTARLSPIVSCAIPLVSRRLHGRSQLTTVGVAVKCALYFAGGVRHGSLLVRLRLDVRHF